jgi:hypothetical protein
MVYILLSFVFTFCIWQQDSYLYERNFHIFLLCFLVLLELLGVLDPFRSLDIFRYCLSTLPVHHTCWLTTQSMHAVRSDCRTRQNKRLTLPTSPHWLAASCIVLDSWTEWIGDCTDFSLFSDLGVRDADWHDMVFFRMYPPLPSKCQRLLYVPTVMTLRNYIFPT